MNEIPSKATQITKDAIFRGRLGLAQPLSGYRFSVDSILLIWFSHRYRGYRCLDLGCGCGVVGLGLLTTGGAREVVGVEIQPRLAALARRNGAESFPESFEVVEGDMRDPVEATASGSFDLVVSNPPFWKENSGRKSSDAERSIACHEIEITVDALTGVARRTMHQRRGKFCTIFPARRLDDLLLALSREGLSAVDVLFVHPVRGQGAESVLVEARPGKSGRMKVEPPLFLKDENGVDTPEATRILSGEFSSAVRASRGDRTEPG